MTIQFIYQALRFLFVIFAFLCILLVLKYTVVYLYPFLIAILLSLILNPFVNYVERTLRFPRTLASITVIAFMLTLIIGSIVFIISELIQGTTYLAENVPAYFNKFITYMENFITTVVLPFYQKLTSFFHTLDPSQQATIIENIQQLASQIATSSTTFLQYILLKVPGALSVLPSSLTIIMIIGLATFLITKDFHHLKDFIIRSFPFTINSSSKNVWIHLKKALFGFFKAQMILISITAFIIYIGLIILKIEHALTIALVTAVVDVFPYLGTGVIFIPWIIYLFITSNYTMTISLSVIYMVIILGRQLLEPKILSSTIGVNPLGILIALFLGVQIWGILGLIFAPILLVLLNACYQSGVFKQIWVFIRGY